MDGTLIDPDGGFPLPAPLLRRQIVARFAERFASDGRPARLALASSRTLPELAIFQRALGVTGPCIAEDGGLLALDADGTSMGSTGHAPRIAALGRRRLHVLHIGATAAAIRQALAPALEGTSLDLLAADDARRARLGFSPSRTRRALAAREASILLDVDGATTAQRDRLDAVAHRAGVTIKRGGRWHAAVIGASKGEALRRLHAAIAARGEAPHGLVVVAVGNEENDATLLREADLPVVINNPGRGHHPALAAIPGARRLEAPGTRGWLELLDRLPNWIPDLAPRRIPDRTLEATR
jgi:mannosyl-3-phosphoglycerate phosphatase